MAKITTVKTHASGIALGGIGAGSVELLPDGEFHFWQIANPPRLTRVCFEDKVDDGEGSSGALSFYVREKNGKNAPVVRKLGMKIDADDFSYRMFAWNKPVERIDFDGRFPMCDLDYTDSALSCKLCLRAVSPFVPFNSDISSTPGFYMDFTAENPTDSDIEISLLGTLVPDFANKDEGNVNSLHTVGNGYAVHIEPTNKSDSPCCGDVCLSVSGDGDKSYITADYYRFLKEFIADSRLGVTQASVLFGFRETGTLPNTDIGTKPEPLPEDLTSLTDAELDALCEKFKRYPYVDSILSRILHCNPDFLTSRENKIFFLDNCYNRNKRRGEDFGGCALCSEVTLEPGEKKKVSIELDERAFSYYNVNINDWHAESGEYKIIVAASSRDSRLYDSVEVITNKPDVEVPDYSDVAPIYYSVDTMATIPDKQFVSVLGRPLPDNSKFKKGELNINCSVSQVAVSPFGKLLYGVLCGGAKIVAIGSENPAMITESIKDMPLRSFSGFTGGLLYGVQQGWAPGKCLQFGWASGALVTTMLTDYGTPADEEQVWSIYKGNARVKR